MITNNALWALSSSPGRMPATVYMHVWGNPRNKLAVITAVASPRNIFGLNACCPKFTFIFLGQRCEKNKQKQTEELSVKYTIVYLMRPAT